MADRATDVGTAWRDVEDNLPEGWVFLGVTFMPAGSVPARKRGPHWRAKAARRTDLGVDKRVKPGAMLGLAATADLALTRLADRLSAVDKRQVVEEHPWS